LNLAEIRSDISEAAYEVLLRLARAEHKLKLKIVEDELYVTRLVETTEARKTPSDPKPGQTANG
jgi:hypothetical protein